jgi:phosphatidylinositol alpha-1,6-mannosyltransferase
VPTTLVITNDFPPRVGGIESFVEQVCLLLDRDVVVYASGPPGCADTDSDRGYPVVRGGSLLLPTAPVATRAADLLRQYGATRVLFGAAAPLGLLAPALRRAGAERVVALSHGHEVWWATVPVARGLLRRIGDSVDHLTTISDYTQSRIAPSLSRTARQGLLRLPPPVDPAIFRPRTRAGEPDRPRAIAVGRLVAQKGFPALLTAWRGVLDEWPDQPLPELVIVGDGPQRPRLDATIERQLLASTVRITGALPRSEVVSELQRADVFVLAVRTRLAGLNPEGLGLAAIEAAACGLPVIIGRSGGAPETVRAGETGYVVEPDDAAALAARLTELLTDRVRARQMGERGRAYAAERFGSDQVQVTLRRALRL